MLAVTLHNIPEGMAVGVVYAGYLAGNMEISAMGALTLSLGIAIQNFPEGAVISMPLRATGMKKSRAFVWRSLWYRGTGSSVSDDPGRGTCHPRAAVSAEFCHPGAMLYVVVEELIPEMSQESIPMWAPYLSAWDSSLMMALDVALG